MRRILRTFQRHRLLRLGLALTVSVAVTFCVWLGGELGLTIALFLAGTLVAFVLLTIAPDAIALQRRHNWRWWWRSSDDDGPFWPGTRIPRRP
ncbi:MAG: hypothetical protein ACR2PL_26705 [Dehalococcoidia bacterium]